MIALIVVLKIGVKNRNSCSDNALGQPYKGMRRITDGVSTKCH